MLHFKWNEPQTRFAVLRSSQHCKSHVKLVSQPTRTFSEQTLSSKQLTSTLCSCFYQWLTTALPELVEGKEWLWKLFHDHSPLKLRGQAGIRACNLLFSNTDCALEPCIINRGSYTKGHFIWNLWNSPKVSFINFICSDYEFKIQFIVWLF